MPGTKRKASFAFPYERPNKITKRTSSTTVSRTLSTVTKTTSVVKPPLKMSKFPSLRASKMDNITKVSASAPLSDVGGSPTPPALRRASTLTLEDDSTRDSAKTALTKRKSSASKPASLSKKSSSFVEEGALVTKLSGLRSGSIIGETSLAASTSMTKIPSMSKSLSRKSSSVKSTDSSSRIPSLPSGLTKLALPKRGSKSGSLHISKSALVSDIDETEMSSALDSLKTHLSKEGSTKRSMSKSASVRSTSSVKKTTESDKGEDMDTTTAGPSSDGLMEVAISFDTTGSMYGCLEEVRAKVQDLIQRLQTDIPGIRVAVIAHGDYCDESNYVIKWIDFGASLPEICDFVKSVGRTGGGDGPECYELVLQRSREVLSWTDGSKRILVMISDDVPHEPGYTYGGKTYYINWRDECAALKEMGVKVYGVQAGYGGLAATHFNDEMARITGGKRLSLKNFSCIFDVLMMICYREGNPEMLAVYEQEIIDRGERMADDITSLKKTFDMASTATAPITHTTPLFGTATTPLFGTATTPLFGTATAPITFTMPLFGTSGIMGTAAAKRAAKTVKPRTGKKNKAKVGKMTSPKKETKKTNKTMTVKKREKLPDSCMNKDALKNFTWSKWICAVEPKMPTSKRKSKFVKLRTNQGYGPKTIFDGNMKVPAIYEVAVQMPGSQKKYVVYFRMSKGGFKRSGHWSTNLLRHKKVRLEVNNVLNQGCSIYIRRGTTNANTTDEIIRQMRTAAISFRDDYDYAWIKYIWRRSRDSEGKFKLNHRLLKFTRKGTTFTLSDNSI